MLLPTLGGDAVGSDAAAGAQCWVRQERERRNESIARSAPCRALAPFPRGPVSRGFCGGPAPRDTTMRSASAVSTPSA